MKIDAKFLYRKIKYFVIKLKYNKWNGWNVGRYFMVGKNVKIEKVKFVAGDNIYIGQNSFFGANVKLGNFCIIADQVNIIGHDHEFKKPGIPIILAGRPEADEKTVTVIEDDVWIGHGVTIIRGARIGEGSIVAANSVVTKDIEPYTINGGLPAKFIKYRFSENEIAVHKAFLNSYRKGLIKLKHDRKL
jgi:chloramphenicol O-acetyltransferase type B